MQIIRIYMIGWSIRDKLEADLSNLYRDEITQDFNSNDYLKLFRHIKDNQIFYKTYFKLGYIDNYKDHHLWYEPCRTAFKPFIVYHMEFLKVG